MKSALRRVCAALLLSLCAGHVHAQTCHEPRTLRLAVIPQMKDQMASGHYDVLVETLASELEREVALVPAGSYGAVVEGMVDGSVDLAELGPGSYVLALERGADITAFASLHRQADATGPFSYTSVLITRHDVGARSLEQLRGSALSLVDPASTSGSIVPRAALPHMTGLPLESWFGRVSFAGSHDAAIDAVLKGRVDAAFVSGNRVEEAMRAGTVQSGTLQIVWRSDPIPYDPFVYQTALCQPVKDAIRQVFFGRQQALLPLLAWRGMDAFVPVSDEDYRHLMTPSGQH